MFTHLNIVLLNMTIAGVIVASVYPPNPARLSADVAKFENFVQDSGAKMALTTKAYKRVVKMASLKHSWPKNLKYACIELTAKLM